ncbi:MAG: hypothetical protein K8I04_00055, partial [Gammaproteobacteria bacterium]|nr:hypothetical protein [Gammaproteobacteria bacterium]
YQGFPGDVREVRLQHWRHERRTQGKFCHRKYGQSPFGHGIHGTTRKKNHWIKPENQTAADDPGFTA